MSNEGREGGKIRCSERKRSRGLEGWTLKLGGRNEWVKEGEWCNEVGKKVKEEGRVRDGREGECEEE